MFHESQRQIFGYFNGEKEVFADPLQVQRKLRQFLGDQEKVVGTLNSDNLSEADSVADLFLDAIAQAFAIPRRFDAATGVGFTEKNLRDLWNKFQGWLDEKKNPPGNSPASPQPRVAGRPTHDSNYP